MRAAVILSALLLSFTYCQAAAEVPSYDAQADVAALRLRVKDLESMNARNGVSVFSFRLAGLMTASRSPFAASHLPAEALSAGSALFDACTADISGLCPDVAAQDLANMQLPDVFHRNADAMKCFSERFSDVSDACVDAAHAADTFMASNREVMKVALKEVAVKDTFEQFQTSCSAEIATKCHGPLADPSLAVANLLASLPQSDHESRGDRWRGQHEHRRLRKLHHDEPSSDEEQGMSGKDAKALELLSRHRALHGDDRPRAGWGRAQDDDLTSESSSEDSGNERGWHHGKKDDGAGGVLGLALIVAVVALSVCLCRRRRMIRSLRERVHQLEMVLAQQSAGQGRAMPHVAVGMPIPQQQSQQRTASDAEHESANLLQRAQAASQHVVYHPSAVVMPQPYPGQAFSYPVS